MQAMQVPTMTVPVEVRDSFTTDPFFMAARQTLEKCLVELTQKHREMQNQGWPGWPAHYCCCCCGPQGVSRFGIWPPAAFIPCLLCCPNVVVRKQPYHATSSITSVQRSIPFRQNSVQLAPQLEAQRERIQDGPTCLLPGQLSFTANNFEVMYS